MHIRFWMIHAHISYNLAECLFQVYDHDGMQLLVDSFLQNYAHSWLMNKRLFCYITNEINPVLFRLHVLVKF